MESLWTALLLARSSPQAPAEACRPTLVAGGSLWNTPAFSVWTPRSGQRSLGGALRTRNVL